MKHIIGHTGLVGKTLCETTNFDYKYNTKNINEFKKNVNDGDEIVLTCLPATKWLVNQNLKKDIENIYDIRDKLHSEHLTIETMYQDPAKIAEASGYIPSNVQRNDPRFKTALTVDVKPDSIKKNAKAFSWLTTRAGIPPTAKPSGKI